MTSVSATTTLSLQQIGPTIQYKADSGSWITIASWPLLITNLNPLTQTLQVLFLTDLNFSSSNSQYFYCLSDNIQFGSQSLTADGSKTTITLTNLVNYVGLIDNGSSGAVGYDNVSVYNLHVVAAGTTTQGTDGGWIGRTSFAKAATNVLIVNCSSSGAIKGGGIIGSYSANNGGQLTIRGCSTSGDISAGCGGILGYNSAQSVGSTITIDRCSSSGTIAGAGGGIVGYYSGTGGTINVTNSYSTGYIDSGSGGIFGRNAGDGGSVTATRCYSIGIINGGGGIFGWNAGDATATNCFTIGALVNGAGGIYAGSYSATAYAYNCYTTGLNGGGGTNGGIWNNSTSNTLQGATNYSERNASSSGWNDSNAKPYLIGDPLTQVGAVWSQPDGPNTAFILTESGYSPYALTLGTTATGTVEAGESSNPAVVPGYTFSLLDAPTGITVDSTTGVISVDTSVDAGEYTLYIYATINPYSITTFTLTVTAPPPPPAPPVIVTACCPGALDLQGVEYTTRNQILEGAAMIPTVGNRMFAVSYDDIIRLKMAYASYRG